MMKLGIRKNLADKIEALMKKTCAGGLARYGSVSATHKAMLERFWHLGRLPQASMVTPGYVF